MDRHLYLCLRVALILIAITGIVLPVILTGTPVMAATRVFTGPGNFSDPSKWGGTLPKARDTLQINGVCIFDNAASNLNYGPLVVGNTAAGTLVWPAGGTNTLRVSGITSRVSGSKIDMTSGGTLQIGRNGWSTTNLTFIPGTGTIIWANSRSNSTLPAAITSYNNLTIASGGRTASLGTATSINGNLLISSGIFSTSTFALNIRGNLTNNATFRPNNGTVTLDGVASQVINGATIPTTFNTLTVNKSNGTATLGVNITMAANLNVNSGVFDLATHTANRVTAGGTLTVANGATMKIGGTNTMPANYTTHSFGLTSTIEYNGAAQTVSSENYAGNLTLSGSSTKTLQSGTAVIGGNLTLSGTASTTTVTGLTINGNLIIGDETSFTIAGYPFTVTGTTAVGAGASGDLIISNAAGAKIFNGLVTINDGAVWNNSGNSAVTFRGGITNQVQGTFISGTGTHTFNTNAQALSGEFLIYSMTVTGVTLTNHGTLTITGALNGTGGLTNAATGVLNLDFSGAAGIAELNATAAGNSVNYIFDGPQTVFATTYHHLTTGTSSTKTLGGAIIVNGDLTIGTGTTLDTDPAFSYGLTLNGNFVNHGIFTGNASSITLSGPGIQNIDGFTTAGNVFMTKTGGTALFSGEVNGGSLVINGSGGTLILGTELTHTFTGAWAMTAGNLDCGSSILNVGGNASSTGGIFTANTGTVNYYASGAQTVAGVNYHHLILSGSGVKTFQPGTSTIEGNLTLSGTASASTLAGLSIKGNLLVTDGAAFTVAGFDLMVTGTTTVGSGASGILTINNNQGTKIFTGVVTINSGGLWNNTGSSDVTFRGGITNSPSGVFTAGSGIHIFDTNAQTLSGSFIIPNVTINAINLTNSGILTVTSSLNGTGGLINAASGVLNIDFGGALGIAGLNATAEGNSVNYTYHGAQTVFPADYHNLTLTGSGLKTFPAGATTINNILSMEDTAIAALTGILNYGTTATLQYKGSTAQFTGPEFLPGGVPNLIINNIYGVTAGSDLIVNGVLNLSTANPSAVKGALEMNNYTLDMGAAAATTGQGDVTGTVRRTSILPDIIYTFGNQWTRVSFVNQGILPVQMSFKIRIGTAPEWKLNAIQRTYDITQTGASNTSATINLYYLDSELNGNVEDQLTFWEYSALSSKVIERGNSNNNPINNWVELANIDISYLSNSFGSRLNTLANSATSYKTWLGSISTEWNNGTNWTDGAPPAATDDVLIPGGTTYNPTLPAETEIRTLRIYNGAVLNGGSDTSLTINGPTSSWMVAGTFNPGSSTVVFTSSQANISGTANLFNLIIGPGAVLYLGDGTYLRIYGSITNNGRLRPDNLGVSTVEYAGGNQVVVIPNIDTLRYSHLILSGSGTKTMPVTTLSILGNFVISGAVSVTLGGALTVYGDLSIGTSTSFNSANHGLTLNGHFINNGTFIAGSSSVTISGTGIQSIAGFSTSGTVLSAKTGGTATFTGNISGGALIINGAGGTLNLGAGLAHLVTDVTLINGFLIGGSSILNIKGTWTGNNGFSAGAGTINFSGSAQTIPTLSYFNLITSGGDIKTLAGAIVTNGDLIINPDTTLDTSSYGITLNGNFINNGTFRANSSSIIISGSGAQSIAGFNTTGSISVTKTGNIATLTGNISGSLLTVNGTGGTLNLGTGLIHSVMDVTLSSGALNGGSSILNISGIWTGTGGFSADTGTINFNGSGAQTIPPLNYFNLVSSSNGARILASSGPIGIAGIFTPGSNSYSISGSTINFNGSGSQTVPAFNYHNLTSSSTGARTLASSGTIGVAGVFTPGINFYITTGSTVNYNGNTAQSIPVFNYHNLEVGNGNTKTLNGAITVNGSLNIGAGTILDVSANSYALIVAGDWLNSGSFTARNGTVTLNGSAVQRISGGNTTFNRLTINNIYGVKAGCDLTVNSVLTLSAANSSATKGALDMDNYTLNMGALATTSGQGDVTGIVRRTSLAPGIEYTFGSQYSRVTFAASGKLPSEMSFKINTGAAPVWKPGAILRTYDIIQTGAANTSATLQVRYLDSELNGNSEGSLVFWDWVSGTSTLAEHGKSNNNTTDNWVSLSAIDISYLPSSFGNRQHTLSDFNTDSFVWNGSVSSDWMNKLNWTKGAIPAAADDVIIPDTANTAFDPTLPTTTTINTLSIQTGGIVNGGNDTLLIIKGSTGAWVGNGIFNPGTSTVEFTSTAAIMSGTGNFYNVTIDPAAVLTLANGSYMRVGGEINNDGTWQTTLFSNTVEYTGIDQIVEMPNGASPGYNNLVLSGSGAVTMPSEALNVLGQFLLPGTVSVPLNGALVVNGDFNIGFGSTLDTASYAVTLNGNFYKNGNFLANASPVTIGGTAIQSIDGFNTTGILSVTKTGGTATFTGRINSGALTINGAGGTLNLGSGLTHTVKGMTLSGGTLNGDSSTLVVGGNWVNNSTFIAGTGTVDLNGTTAMTIGGAVNTSFNNLTINNTVNLNTSTAVNGILTLNIGSFNVGAYTLTLNGPAIAGSPVNLSTTSSSNLIFGGNSADVKLPGSVTALNNLTINNPCGLILNSSPTISGTLSLTSGHIVTGSNTLILAAAGSISGGNSSSYVKGNLRKAFNKGSGQSFTFPVGDAAAYTPVNMSSLNVSTAGYLTLNTTGGDHPNLATSGIDPNRSINRYWTLIPGGGLTAVYNAAFNYPGSDLDIEADAPTFVVLRYSSGSWTTSTVSGTPTTASTTISSETGFGDFSIGNPHSPSTISSVALYQADHVTSVSAMSPQIEYAVKVTVNHPNTLAILNSVRVTIFYDSDGIYSAGDVPTSGNSQTSAVLTCMVGGTPSWNIDPGANTTWSIITANCVQPALANTTGDFWFHFKPGKVATATTGNARWHIYSRAISPGGSAVNYQDNRTMNWYGEITVNTPSIDFGTVAMGSDFSANPQTGISVTYICNSSYKQQIKASSPWSSSGYIVTLNSDGIPGEREFSLKADDTFLLESSVIVGTDYLNIGTGSQTGESGRTQETNTLWLKLGASGIPAVLYSGTIYYAMTQ